MRQASSSGRSLRQRIHAILSDSAWQGIGPIISLVTLGVTIFLTYHVFHLTSEQQKAHFSSIQQHGGLTATGLFRGNLLTITNYGPSAGERVHIIASADGQLMCDVMSSAEYMRLIQSQNFEVVQPQTKSVDGNRCDLFYETFYKDTSTVIMLNTEDVMGSISYDSIRISISGANADLNEFTYSLKPLAIN